MATSADALRQWRRDRPNQVHALGVALVVLTASLWVGLQSKSASADLARKRVEWQRTADQLATVQQQFRIPTSRESAALIAESGRMGALGVPQAERVSLMEFLVNLAEASALTEVRVGFVTNADSGYLPPRAIGADAINAAPYSVTLDFTGSFAGLVQFVSSLPPSVSLSRLGGARRGGQTVYHVLLSVYELPNGPNAG